MNKLDKLTWKYFWKQKWEEISLILLYLFIILGILGVAVQIGWINKPAPDNYPICDSVTPGIPRCWADPYEPMLPRWIMYTGFVTTGIWIIIGLNYWLSTNWNKARERAKKEVKKK